LDAEALARSASEPSEARRARARQLYLSLSRFIADNFLHMAVEETEMNPMLWQAFTDEELLGIYQAIIASEPPAQLELSVKWLLPAIPPDERAKVVCGARAAMPIPVFEHVLGGIRAVLAPEDFVKLARALGLERAAA
jgi:hypothetical protein